MNRKKGDLVGGEMKWNTSDMKVGASGQKGTNRKAFRQNIGEMLGGQQEPSIMKMP